MTLATLADLLPPAVAGGYAVAGLVVEGWEDANAYVEAAETTKTPIILQAGPGCRRHTPVPVLGKMLRGLAEAASVPIACHVDHARTVEECLAGIESGFTSVMFDGSDRPLGENIDLTGRIVELAHSAGVSVEGEIGIVGYRDGSPSKATDPHEAARFETSTGVDALAVSVGNVHLQMGPGRGVDMAALRSIEAVTHVPLVLHGASGIPVAQRLQLARQSRVAKFNIGTELRMAYGAALRAFLRDHADTFDQIEIGLGIRPAIVEACVSSLHSLGRPGS